MPAMPRPKKAQKIIDGIMKKKGASRPVKEERKHNGEDQYERNIRMTIKR